MLTLATRPHGGGTQTRTAAPTQPLPPAETTADPSTATPARRVAEALDKAVEGLGAAFENFEITVRLATSAEVQTWCDSRVAEERDGP